MSKMVNSDQTYVQVTVLFVAILDVCQHIQVQASQPLDKIVILADQMKLQQLITYHHQNNGTKNRSKDRWWTIDSGSEDLRLLMFVTYHFSCSALYFQIFDGMSTENTSLVKHGVCGTTSKTSTYSTTQRYALVETHTFDWHSDASLNVTAVATRDYSGMGCNSTQSLTPTDNFKYISSPRFPDEYSSLSQCRWTVSNPYGQIYFEVITVDIEDDDEPTKCQYDALEIYDGKHKCENNRIAMYCSGYPNFSPMNYTTSSSTLTVIFRSDGDVNKSGFLLRFKLRSTENSTHEVQVFMKESNKTLSTKIKKFQVWNSNQSISKFIFATSLNDLKTKVKSEFELPDSDINLILLEIYPYYVSFYFTKAEEIFLSTEPVIAYKTPDPASTGHETDVTADATLILAVVFGTVLIFIISLLVGNYIIKRFTGPTNVSKIKVKPAIPKQSSIDFEHFQQSKDNSIHKTMIRRISATEKKPQRKLSVW